MKITDKKLILSFLIISLLIKISFDIRILLNLINEIKYTNREKKDKKYPPQSIIQRINFF